MHQINRFVEDDCFAVHQTFYSEQKYFLSYLTSIDPLRINKRKSLLVTAFPFGFARFGRFVSR